MKQVYDENVPHKLSEKDFWKVSPPNAPTPHVAKTLSVRYCTFASVSRIPQKYFQSQYFHRDRLTGTTINVAERDIFDRCAEVRTPILTWVCRCGLTRCLQEDERVYAPPVKRPRGIDPTVDVSGEDVLPDGYGDAETLCAFY